MHCPGFHMEVIDEHTVGGNATMIIALDLFAEGSYKVNERHWIFLLTVDSVCLIGHFLSRFLCISFCSICALFPESSILLKNRDWHEQSLLVAGAVLLKILLLRVEMDTTMYSFRFWFTRVYHGKKYTNRLSHSRFYKKQAKNPGLVHFYVSCFVNVA